MQRRRFLKVGAASAAGLGLLGGVLGLRSGDYPSVGDRDLRVLDAKSFWILAAVAGAVGPGGDPLGAQLAEETDVSLRTWARVDQDDFKLALGLVENGLAGLFLRGSPSVFTSMAVADRNEALFALRDSRVGLVRAIYQSLRRTVLTVHYSDYKRSAVVGYRGPRWEKPRMPAPGKTGALSEPYVPKPVTREPSEPPTDPAASPPASAKEKEGVTP